MNKAAQALGKLGGSVKSKRKTEAARKNGKRGGRPHRHRWLNGLNDSESKYVYCGGCGEHKFKKT